MKTLGAYLYLSELSKDLQNYLQDNCYYEIGDSPFYVIDNLGNIESNDNFICFVSSEDNRADNSLKLGIDIIPIEYSIELLNDLEELRHTIKLKVAENLTEAIKKEQYMSCFE